MQTKLNTIILDDHPLILTGLIGLLKQCDHVASVHTFQNAHDLREHVTKNPVDLAIVDLRIANSESGLEVAKFLKQQLKQKIAVLIFSAHVERSYVNECLLLDVDAYVSKDSPIEEIKTAIEQIANGERYYSEDVKEVVFNHLVAKENSNRNILLKDKLTRREVEVLRLICKGSDYRKVSEILFISENTARKHRQNIMIKTNCHNTTDLYRYALDHHFI